MSGLSSVRVPLHSRDGSVRAYALIDASDAPLVTGLPWHLASGYAASSKRTGDGKGTTLLMHRVITSAPPDREVDHINHDRLDNRRSNLRLTTRAQNGQNLGAVRPAKSGATNVRLTKEGKFRVELKVNGRFIQIGNFPTLDAAVAARNDAKRIYHPFAPTRFITALKQEAGE